MIKTNIQVGWNMKIMQDLSNSNNNSRSRHHGAAAATRQNPIQKRRKDKESKNQPDVLSDRCEKT